MHYAELIEKLSGTTHDPRHIEAYMRVEHRTLNHLSKKQFKFEIKIAIACIEADGDAIAEKLAQSYGL